ncbi:MAG: hypothetical protein ACFFFG_07565 [Candidatus Thorarchaeota archaeon]
MQLRTNIRTPSVLSSTFLVKLLVTALWFTLLLLAVTLGIADPISPPPPK